MNKITYEQYKKIFKKNSDGSYVNMKILDYETGKIVNLSGKKPKDYSYEEVLLLKDYARKISELVDMETVK